MSSEQKNAAKGKVHNVPQNQGWTALSWDDLTEWAGPRSVERGRAYQKQGRVHDLAISEDGWLLATVRCGERYAVTVWCEKSATDIMLNAALSRQRMPLASATGFLSSRVFRGLSDCWRKFPMLYSFIH
jgi:uncharacterized Zn finger protein